MPPDHYSHGNQTDPDVERELREWSFAQPNDPEPEFAPIARQADEPLYSLDDYAAWRGMEPGRVGVLGG